MKIAVILENAPDCELAREQFDVEAGDDDAIDVAASAVIDSWTLSVGDTIRIVEVVS